MLTELPQSLAVEEPEIKEVLDLESGLIISANHAIGSDYGQAMALRMALKESIASDSPLYACPICGIPVYLVSLKERRKFFFRHDLEDGRCPARTRGELSEEEINARKYNGAKESRAHIRMKNIVAESLRADHAFSSVRVEAVWKARERSEWRKPDVQAVYKGIPVAFEIQLSTTFLRVIAERRAFYTREGGLLFWIFKTFDADNSRLTQDDIFYNNNRNLFLISEETLNASNRAAKFMLECCWNEPFLVGNKIETRWSEKLISFDELVMERDKQRVFFYDYDHAIELLQPPTPDPFQVLRDSFESFWFSRKTNTPYDKGQWQKLRADFNKIDITLPLYPDDGKDGPYALLNALYSAREGRPIGWKFEKLIQVAHQIEQSHKCFLRIFRHALDTYHRAELMKLEDKEGKWRAKVKIYLPLLADNNPEYEHDRRFDGLVDILFPELSRIQPAPRQYLC